MEQVKEGVGKVTQATASSVSQRMLANTKKLFDMLKTLDSSVEKVIIFSRQFFGWWKKCFYGRG